MSVIIFVARKYSFYDFHDDVLYVREMTHTHSSARNSIMEIKKNSSCSSSALSDFKCNQTDDDDSDMKRVVDVSICRWKILLGFDGKVICSSEKNMHMHFKL